MDVPDLVRQAVGDEEIRAGVNLGDEDAVVFTPTRTLVYRGEGLLSDEAVSEYGFDFERLAVSEGRRKTKFTMTYVDGEQSFTVPGKRTDDVLEQLIEGMLRLAGAVEGSESVTGVFRFSEMTLVVSEGRLLKHIGEYTWDADFEAFPYDDLTKLAFEEGSVATQVVLGVGSRSERIKAPNAEAGLVRKHLQEAVFAHHGVSSLEELNREIAVEPDEDPSPRDATGGLGLDSGIDPLVSDDPEPAEADEIDLSGDQPSSTQSSQQSEGRATGAGAAESSSSQSRENQSTQQSSPQRQSGNRSQAESSTEQSGSQSSDAAESDHTAGSKSAANAGSRDSSSGTGGKSTAANEDPAAVPSAETSSDEVTEQLADLTRAVERQNELLHRQQKTVEKLIEELRQGR